eukprot:6909953-Alexandrium_andersonii.AAC.1
MRALPPHEALHREATEDPGMHERLEESIEAGDWAIAYREHPLAQTAGPRPIPVALYLDATPYSKHDGVLCITVHNLVTDRRHLLACLRRSCLC